MNIAETGKEIQGMKELLLVNRINPRDKQTEYNPVCHDDKIHIRLKHYTSNKTIIGFEDKLTFLLVWLINNFLKTLENKPEFKADLNISKSKSNYDSQVFVKYVLRFKDTDEYRILSEIVSNKFVTCKDIRISSVYSRKDHPDVWDMFGHISPNLLPKVIEGINSLSLFIKTCDISLQDYLFNDNYVLLISNFKFKNPNTKFENKLNKKITKRLEKTQVNENLKENDLW